MKKNQLTQHVSDCVVQKRTKKKKSSISISLSIDPGYAFAHLRQLCQSPTKKTKKTILLSSLLLPNLPAFPKH